MLIVGPSAGGKNTVIKGLLRTFPGQIEQLTTYTTRPIRPNEAQGREYHYVSEEVFQQKVRSGEIFEKNRRETGYIYGSGMSALSEQLGRVNVIKDLEGNGFTAVSNFAKESGWPLVSLFIWAKPKELEKRLRNPERGHGEEEIQKRLGQVSKDMLFKDACDYCFESTTIEEDLARAVKIYLDALKAHALALPKGVESCFSAAASPTLIGAGA